MVRLSRARRGCQSRGRHHIPGQRLGWSGNSGCLGLLLLTAFHLLQCRLSLFNRGCVVPRCLVPRHKGAFGGRFSRYRGGCSRELDSFGRSLTASCIVIECPSSIRWRRELVCLAWVLFVVGKQCAGLCLMRWHHNLSSLEFLG